MSDTTFKLIMISAMYENGGNTTHRFLDGHPSLYVYPFESQPGTKYVNDHLSGMFPAKYRWPLIPADASAEAVYKMIIDEECKVRARTPNVSKFKNYTFDFSDDERCGIFCKLLEGKQINRVAVMEAFFVSTFKAWKNHRSSGKETTYVGYSPIIGVDGEKIINDFNGNAHILHVIRNPFSCYAETKKRAVPLSLDHYIAAWVTCQYYALYLSEKFPDNFTIVRYEDIIDDPQDVLGSYLEKFGLEKHKNLKETSWNNEKLKEVYPWGTIKTPSIVTNLTTAKSLSKEEVREIFSRTELYIKHFDYSPIFKKPK
ncbi:MAG: sulfotransferase [Bacteroidetes bacterium]|nr:sulfotransferase [Bacteroidota bacterium]MBU1719678.1 sulfotransferase [Bacteroidota bacterium]